MISLGLLVSFESYLSEKPRYDDLMIFLWSVPTAKTPTKMAKVSNRRYDKILCFKDDFVDVCCPTRLQLAHKISVTRFFTIKELLMIPKTPSL